MPPKAKKVKVDINNDAWIADHFEEIVDKYGGKYPYILVSRNKIFPIKPGDNIVKIEKEITKKYGKPIGMPVPRPEALRSFILSF